MHSDSNLMPPWFADPRWGSFANDARLSSREIETVQAWVAEYIFTALVVIACLGEFIAEFTDWLTNGEEKRKKRLAKGSTILLMASLSLEPVCLIKTNNLSGQVIGSISQLAREATDKAKKALADSGLAEATSERATEKSDKGIGVASNAEQRIALVLQFQTDDCSSICTDEVDRDIVRCFVSIGLLKNKRARFWVIGVSAPAVVTGYVY